ncbi:MAG: ATP-binding cassette domain-containing protein, partial [Anaerolineales bacterium]
AIKALRTPNQDMQEIKLNLRPRKRSGNIIIRTHQLKVGYPGNELFESPDIELHRQECASLIGPNGAGKTTFLRTILGEHSPLSGQVELGASLDIGYFAQAHEDLNPENNLIQEIESVAPDMLVAEIRSFLARYLFKGEDVFKPVSVLSGGERGRMALAKLALSDANLLLLDEPTNHLDIPAQEVLQNVMADFDGTIILVSHDRYLIDALGTQIWEIIPDEGRMEVFEGTYSEYRSYQESQKDLQIFADEARSQGALAFQEDRAAKNRALAQERRRQTRLHAVETRVTELEAQLAHVSEQLAHPPDNPDIVLRLSEDYNEIQNELDALIVEWEQLHS